MIQSTQHHLRNLVEQCDNMSMTSSGTGLLVFSDDGTEDRSSWKNSAKLTGRRFIVQMEDEPKRIAKATL